MSTDLNFIDYKELAKNFKTEEDVRAETNMYLKILCEQFGISTKDSGHEITSYFGGRADSMYSDVIIEYKSPKINLKTQKGFDEVVYGRDDKDHGLFHYLVNFSLQDSLNDNDLFVESIRQTFIC